MNTWKSVCTAMLMEVGVIVLITLFLATAILLIIDAIQSAAWLALWIGLTILACAVTLLRHR